MPTTASNSVRYGRAVVRRCTSDELPCLDLLAVRFSRATAQSWIEEIYAEIQQQRRDAAEAQTAEESADDVF